MSRSTRGRAPDRPITAAAPNGGAGRGGAPVAASRPADPETALRRRVAAALGLSLLPGLGALLLGAPAAVAASGVLGSLLVAAALAARVEHRRAATLELELRRLADALAAANGDAPLPAASHPALAAVGGALRRVLAAAAHDRRRLREVAARAFRAQENERLRIASELQEQTAQSLAGLLIRLRVARGSADPELRERVLEEIRAGLAEATDSVRRYARGLFPPALEDLGVVAAIEAYALALSEHGGPVITVAAEDVRGILARDGELALYRVVQESLANAVRHAGAGRVQVQVTRYRGGVRATVQDDGAGFDLKERQAAHPCLGLLGLRERALYAGGSAHVSSRPGAGTRVAVELPGIDRRPSAELPPIVAPLGAAHMES